LVLLVCLFGTQGVASTSTNIIEDTLRVELEDGSVIMIVTEDQEALKNLSEYDLNEMLQGVVLRVDSATQLLPDSIKEEEVKRIRIRVANMEFTIVPDEDDFEDELESIFDDEWEDDEDIKRVNEDIEWKPKPVKGSIKIDFGFNNWLENGSFPDQTNPYSARTWGSWYFGLGWNTRFHIKGTFFNNLAINWNVNTLKWEDYQYRIVRGEERVEFSEELQYSGTKSKMDLYYLNVEYIPMFDFGYKKRNVRGYEGKTFSWKTYKRRGFRIGAGVYGGYRLGTKSKFVSLQNGDKVKDKEHNSLYANNWRYGVKGVVGYRGIDFFFAYDLNPVFQDNRGPLNADDLRLISFGITLVTW